MFSRWRDRNRAAALDKHWDELLVADGSRSPGAMNGPAAAEAIDLVLAHDDAPPIDRIFFATLQKDLEHMHSAAHGIRTNHHGVPAMAAHRPIWNPPRAEDRLLTGVARPWFAALAGLAALILLVALGISTIRPGGSDEPEWIPAAILQEDEIDTDTLLDIAFAPGQMRGVDEGLLIYSQSLVAPHTTLGFSYACEPDSPTTFLVTEGTMTATVKTPSAILRAGATEWETIPGGVTTDIGAGDAWYFENRAIDDVTAIGNLADEDLRFIWVAVRGNEPACTSGPPSGLREEWIYIEPGSSYLDPSQPVRILLQSVSIPAGVTVDDTLGTLAPPTEERAALGARQWIAVIAGKLSVTIAIDGEENPIVHRWRDGRVLTQDDVRSNDDRTITFSNESDEPLELLVLSIAVGDPEAAGGVQAPMIASPVPAS